MKRDDRRTDLGPPRRRLRKLALAALGAGLGGLVCEAWARSNHGAPWPERLPLLEVEANPYRGWSMVPGQDHFTYLEAVEVNALGLRGPEVPERVPGSLRLLCVGDSLVYGQGVGEGDTLPAHLGAHLPGAVVLNGGLRAYGTAQELGLLEELGPTVDPDLVLLCWYWNDIDEREIEATHAKLSASGPIVFDTGDPWSPSGKLLWRTKQLVRRSAILNLLHDRLRANPWESWDDAFIDEGIQRLDGYLSRFVELCDGLGARYAVVLMPDPGGSMGGNTSGRVGSRAADLFGERGLPFCDLRPAMNRYLAEHRRAPVIPFDGHFDGEGNRFLAAELSAWLAESGLVPPSEPRD